MGTVPTPANPGAGTVLTSTETASWFNTQAFLLQPPSCRVSIVASTALASGANTIAWTTEGWDIVQSGDTEMHSTTVNTDRVTIRTAGRYRVHGAVSVSSSVAGQAYTNLFKNGVWTGVRSWVDVSNTSTVYSPAFTDEVQCAVGDYLTLVVNTTNANMSARGDTDVHMVVSWVSN